ncbi:MAG TPA: HAD-IB family hydrolase [Kofleriaceae bacterium]|jgi:HAD superfamily hydrolase (TIGR01490 family)|nr:HAD-IB family hydrolase [Kofleriaceae bacterium]
MRAALFDMDNTLLTVDTGTSWTRFLYRRGELPASMVMKAIYWSTLYKLAVLDMESVFTKLCLDLAGDSEAEMIAKCDVWYRDHVAPFVAPAARVAVEHHRQRGDVIVLATGSTVYAARPVARGVGIEHVLASVLEVDDAGAFTGKPSALCFGHHKVTLVERWAADHGIDLAQSTFYSDSFNDLPLLERVGTAVAVNADSRLRRHAQRRGWALQQWS